MLHYLGDVMMIKLMWMTWNGQVDYYQSQDVPTDIRLFVSWEDVSNLFSLRSFASWVLYILELLHDSKYNQVMTWHDSPFTDLGLSWPIIGELPLLGDVKFLVRIWRKTNGMRTQIEEFSRSMKSLYFSLFSIFKPKLKN